MSKRKILTLAMALSIVAILAVGATLAYFTDTDENTNVFTIGNVDITLDEAKVERDENGWDVLDVRVKENKYEAVYPGAVLPKDPTIHNVGDCGAFVRVKVTVVNGITMLPMYAANDTLTDDLFNDAFVAMVDGLGAGWYITDGIDAAEAMKKLMNSETDATFVITYAPEVASMADTTPVFEQIVIPADWAQDDSRLVSLQETGFKINVVAEAIQADGFKNAEEAFDKYK